MIKLTDENPYEVFDLLQNADKKALDKAFARKNRGNNKHLARKAYDVLRKPEERLLVDALTPIIIDSPVDESELIVPEGGDPDWMQLIDASLVYRQDLQALTEAIIRHFFTPIAPPVGLLELSTEFDGLKEFEAQWLK